MDGGRALYFRNRDEWRKWLEKNYDKEKSVWLIHYKKDSTNTGIKLDEAVEDAICFGWIDSKLKKVDDEKYILKYTPRNAKSVWSKINREKAEKMIKLGQMTNAGLLKIKESKKTGFWQKAYTDTKEVRLPADLKKALFENQKAWKNFQNFANTYKNMYVRWVINAKTENTKRKRIEQVVLQSQENKKTRLTRS
jgi:uncharacterized protein YdeI (YjbR/CyaY-like superfamily)